MLGLGNCFGCALAVPEGITAARVPECDDAEREHGHITLHQQPLQNDTKTKSNEGPSRLFATNCLYRSTHQRDLVQNRLLSPST